LDARHRLPRHARARHRIVFSVAGESAATTCGELHSGVVSYCGQPNIPFVGRYHFLSILSKLLSISLFLVICTKKKQKLSEIQMWTKLNRLTKVMFEIQTDIYRLMTFARSVPSPWAKVMSYQINKNPISK
jgi:hypothetical protein